MGSTSDATAGTATDTTETTVATTPPTTDATTTGDPVDLSCENYCGVYATVCVDVNEFDNADASRSASSGRSAWPTRPTATALAAASTT